MPPNPPPPPPKKKIETIEAFNGILKKLNKTKTVKCGFISGQSQTFYNSCQGHENKSNKTGMSEHKRI